MADSPEGYHHRQIGWIILGSLGGALLAIALPTVLLIPGSEITRFSILVLAPVAVLGGMFSSLTVRVTEETVEWWFGPGLWTYTVPLSEVKKVCVAETTVWEGWGIRYTTQGPLYNVSGFRAVGIEKMDGSYVRIGTDEPEVLCRTIERVRTDTSN